MAAAERIVIHRTSDPVQAEMLTELLARAGIAAVLHGGANAARFGAAQFIIESRIEVPKSQAERAAEITEAFLHRVGQAASDLPALPEADRSRDPVWSPIIGLTALHGALLWASGSIEDLQRIGGLSGWPPPSQMYRLVTHAFLHTNISHLVGNTCGLVPFGWASIRLFGLGRTTLAYALAALASGVSVAVTFNRGVAVGASGAVFALAALVLVGRLKLALGVTVGRRRELIRLAGLALLMLPSALAFNYASHLTGLAVGAALGLALPPAPIEPTASFVRRNRWYGLVGALVLFAPWGWRIAQGR